MSSQIFEEYRHSGKYNVQGPLLALVAAGVAAFPLGYVYAYVVKWIPFIYVNFLATMGYGFVFGFMTSMLMQYFKVRNTTVAVGSAIGAGLIALFFAWNAHIHAVFTGVPWFIMPNEMMGAVKQLYEEGSWTLRGGTPVTGFVLGIVWLVEAGIILGFTVMLPYSQISDTPFCETSQCWLDQEKKIDTLAPFTDPTQIQALKAGDLGPLLQAQPRVHGMGEFARLKIKESPQAQTFCTVRLENITLETDKDGNVSEKVKELTGNLKLPHEMAGLITKFEKFSQPLPTLPA